MEEELQRRLDALQERFGNCSAVEAVKQYIEIMPPGEYAFSRLRYFSEATDENDLIDRCLTEVAIQELLLSRLKGISSFFPARYLDHPRYLQIKVKIQAEYDRALENNPGLEDALKKL